MTTVSVPRDGGEMSLTIWTPDQPPRAAIVLIQEIFGVAPYIRAVGERLEQQHLGRATGLAAQAQSRRDHLGVVDHEQVTVAEQVGQVAHVAMLGRRAPPVDQQTRRVPRLDRVLGDALVGQLVVDVGESHGERPG